MFVLSDETLPILDELKTEHNYGTNHHQNNEATSSTAGQSTSCNIVDDRDNVVRGTLYPVSVKIVLLSKLFESLTANGIRTILILHLHDYLMFRYHTSVTILHAFNFVGQFSPLLGAILADNYFGNTRTILFFLVIYVLGFIGIILVTLPIEMFRNSSQIFLSLFLVSLGNGSIRACLTSLGGLQYKLPEEKINLNSFFSLYYLVYTFGILLSKFIPPIIRSKVSCFGETSCYSVVYGFLFSMLLLSSITFIIGLKFYKHVNVKKKSILFLFLKYVFVEIRFFIKSKIYFVIRNRNGNSDENYLNQFDANFLSDIGGYFRVIKLFIPLPVYWALLAQQDSTWTIQATKMDTQIFGVDIPPDQIKTLGPIFLLILIPLWEKRVNSLLKRFNINLSPIMSIILGGLFASMSFLFAGLNELNINNHFVNPTILLQIPQFLFIMLGEVLLSIPGLQFSFTQAPDTMVSLLIASWFVNNAVGNLIVIIITKLEIFQSQTNEFFFYSIAMLISMLWFYCISRNYKYINLKETNDTPKIKLRLK